GGGRAAGGRGEGRGRWPGLRARGRRGQAVAPAAARCRARRRSGLIVTSPPGSPRQDYSQGRPADRCRRTSTAGMRTTREDQVAIKGIVELQAKPAPREEPQPESESLIATSGAGQ